MVTWINRGTCTLETYVKDYIYNIGRHETLLWKLGSWSQKSWSWSYIGNSWWSTWKRPLVSCITRVIFILLLQMLRCGRVHWRRARSIHYAYRAHKKVAHYNLLLLTHQRFVMRPSSLGGGRILRRTLSVCPSVPLWSLPSVTSRHLANYNDTRGGPHNVRPSRPH